MRAVVLLVAVAVLAGCDDGESDGPDGTGLDMSVDVGFELDDSIEDGAVLDAGADGAVDALADVADMTPSEETLYGAPGCEELDPSYCLYPWPSSRFLVADETRASGWRLAPSAGTLPVSAMGSPVEPALVERADGFPIGTPIMVHLPGVDLAQLPGEESIERSVAADTRLGLFEVGEDGARLVPCFAELDLRERRAAARSLIVRPAVLLREDTRYVVALRDLVGVDGAPIAASPGFAALRDGMADGIARLEARRDAMDEVFALLEGAGWSRGSLTVAWDFRTASHASLHGDILHMRDDALAQLGDDGPELVFDEVIERSVDEDLHIALEINGHITVPHYMRPVEGWQGETAWVFDRGEDGRPVARSTRDAPFLLLVPRAGLDGEALGLIQYGHGLNGSRGQTASGHHKVTADEYGYVYYGADMVGMSRADVTNIIGLVTDVNRFVWLADRLHQGMLESVLLARAMTRRLATMPELIERGIVIDGTRSYWEGNSQGGIFGATHLALSPDHTRAVLGVPGQNYSTLLERSVDFSPFFLIFDAMYGDRRDQLMLLALMQVLWDSIDPVSHYRHLSAEPHPGNAPSHALLGLAKGDWQVALLTIEIAARSGLGVELMENYDPERAPALIEPVPYPHTGTGVVNWNYGNPWPPAGNEPPDDEIGDPHGWPRKEPDYRRQAIHFLETGEIIDVCGRAPCVRERP